MGSRFAEVDGKQVDMGREPVRYISHLYVPIHFLAAALEGEVSNRDPKTRKVTVTGLNNYTDSFYGGGAMGYNYWIYASEGDLEITNGRTGKKDIIPLGMKDINVNTHALDITLKWTPKNLLVVTVEYTHRLTGEYDLYTLVFKNQGLIRKGTAHGLMEKHEIIHSDGSIKLMDDKYTRIIEDGTGTVLEAIAH